VYVVLVAGMLLCAVLAIRAARLLLSALWLAGVSVLTAILLYLMGAREVAVIELSVGAGLVTVLFVFAISIAGENAMQARPVVPRSLAFLLVGAVAILLVVLTVSSGAEQPATAGSSFATTFWQGRALDVLAQIALIFAGVLGVLGLLSEKKPSVLAFTIRKDEAIEPAIEEVEHAL